MVMPLSSLSSTGVKDWIIQRISAVILFGYFIFLVAFILLHPHLDYVHWRLLFSSLSMRLANTLALCSLCLHAWIGLWTIITDYVKHPSGRLILELIIILGLFISFFWGMWIFWRL